MSMLQVRNLPDDLHQKLGERSKRLGMSMSEYVTRVLRADLERPLFTDWATEAQATGHPREIDVLGALDDARGAYSPHVA